MDYNYGKQYTTTSYGARGTVGGGGFTADDTTSPGGKGGEYAKETIRPVTIKQILDATQAHPEADFKIDGAEIHMVELVGQVRNISSQTMFTTYKLDDGTGEVEVKLWADSGASDEMDTTTTASRAPKQKVVLNGYVRTWGRLRMFNNKLHVGTHLIRPLKNLNEVHYHLLEATAIHLYYTRGPPPNQQGSGGPPQAAGVADINPPGDTTLDGKPLPPMSPSARRLYQTLSNTPQSNEGLHVQHLAAEMGLPVNELYKAGEELLSMGLIYQTVDDNTWAIMGL